MSNERVPSGNEGLDIVLHGGFMPRSSTLLVGEAGTGKTILSLQWLLSGASAGEVGLYVSLVEPAQVVARHVAGLGWRLDPITVLDLAPSGHLAEGALDEYRVFPPEDVEPAQEWEKITRGVSEQAPQRVVIDSLTHLAALATDRYQLRKRLQLLLRFLDEHGCTTLLLADPHLVTEEPFVEMVVDGSLWLTREVSNDRVITLRAAEARKLRGSDFESGRHPLKIGAGGLTVFPHLTQSPEVTSIGATMVCSGVPALDDLTGGGLESGTATLITGPSGVGKSTLAMSYAVRAAASAPVLYLSFEESVASHLERAARLGLDAAQAVAEDRLTLRHLNPLQLYPDELLEMLRSEVAGAGRTVVVIDSLRGYNLAMEQFGSLVAHMMNLVAYCRGQGVTVLLVNEIESITGALRLTEVGVSYLADNALLLRYAELDGRIVRVIACLKKRLGGYEPELRELTIGPGGLALGPRLEGLRGLLTGTPERSL